MWADEFWLEFETAEWFVLFASSASGAEWLTAGAAGATGAEEFA